VRPPRRKNQAPKAGRKAKPADLYKSNAKNLVELYAIAKTANNTKRQSQALEILIWDKSI
jgi:hypothetical protein